MTTNLIFQRIRAGARACLLCGIFHAGAARGADGQDWPQWRGPAGNGVSLESGWNPAALAGGAKVLWSVNVGGGYSSVTLQGRHLYTLGWQDNQDVIRCLNAETGAEVWRHSYACKSVPTSGSRTTPAVDSGLLYTLSAQGLVFCLDASSGSVKWQRDLVVEKQAKVPFYGFCGSPRVAGDFLLLNAGVSGIALDKNTGRTIWASAAEQGGYATPVVCEMAGRKCAALFGQKALYMVEIKTGAPLWSYPWDTGYDSNCADPIILGSKVFLSTCYEKGNVAGDKGCVLLDASDGKPKPVWQNLNMRNHFSSGVALSGYVYGFDGRAGDKKSSLKCIDLATGEEKWSQALGFGSLMAADGKLILLNEKGVLFIAEATPAGYRELAKAEGILPKNCWTAPILCGDRIFCRNDRGGLVCIDVSR